jgi:hypothetical protein
MAVITRASLPEEFYDITSAQLLLQPEPQYLHAQLAKMAVASDLAVPGSVGLPGRDAGAQGAAYASPSDGRLMLSDPIMGAAITAIVGLGSAPGHTIRMNRPKFTNSTYTEASREVASGSTISTTPLDLDSEQVAVTIKRFAGPYGTANVQPYALDEFDAKMSVHKLAGMIGLHLKRDFDRWLDAALVALYAVCDDTVRPVGMTNDDSASTADAFPLDVNTLFRAEETLDTDNIPAFANGRRACVLHPRQLRELKDDAQFGRYAQYDKNVNPLFQSYVTSIGNLDIFKSNTLTTSTNSSSVVVYRGQVFGPGKVGLGVGQMPRVLHSTDDNYGLQAKIIWEFEAGLVNLDNRFGCLVSST